jgi:hypothetical protein
MGEIIGRIDERAIAAQRLRTEWENVGLQAACDFLKDRKQTLKGLTWNEQRALLRAVESVMDDTPQGHSYQNDGPLFHSLPRGSRAQFDMKAMSFAVGRDEAARVFWAHRMGDVVEVTDPRAPKYMGQFVGGIAPSKDVLYRAIHQRAQLRLGYDPRLKPATEKSALAPVFQAQTTGDVRVDGDLNLGFQLGEFIRQLRLAAAVVRVNISNECTPEAEMKLEEEMRAKRRPVPNIPVAVAVS